MGCFNSIGFYSKMPIHYNDNVVLFICAGYNYNSATYDIFKEMNNTYATIINNMKRN